MFCKKSWLAIKNCALLEELPAALLIFCLMCGGCSLIRFGRLPVKPDLNVIVEPRSVSYRQGRAGIVFFSSNNRYPSLPAECTAIFQKAFLKHKDFKIVEQCSTPDHTEEYLMDLALDKGYDILVRGNVTDFLLAYGAEKSRVALSIKVYDVKSRVTLWNMEWSVEAGGVPEKDWILWRRSQKPPPSPYVLLRHIAQETARMMAR
ncbi:MAG: hypothetical protein ACMUIP_00130 [bacterium]